MRTTKRQRLLTTARLVGAAALGVVAQVAVDMPDGYFGAADRVTAIGTAYAAGLRVSELCGLDVGALRRRAAGTRVVHGEAPGDDDRRPRPGRGVLRHDLR